MNKYTYYEKKGWFYVCEDDHVFWWDRNENRAKRYVKELNTRWGR